MKFAFLIQDPGFGGLASMHNRMEEALKDSGHHVDNFIVQKEDVINNVREGDYDVVHLYFTPFLNSKFFLRLLKFNILSDTQIFVNYYNIKPENLFRRTVKRTFLPLLCDKVILPSENMEEFYRDEIKISNTSTLRPIVEDKFFDIESSNDKIVHFGHARPDKGIDRLMYMASEEHPVHCYFIQDDETVLKRFPEMKEKIGNGEIFLHEGLPEKALSEAKLAVFPYHNLEKTVDLPLALLESLAAGIPVLTSDIRPLNEYLPDEFLVDNWNNTEPESGDKDCRHIAKKIGSDKESVISSYINIIRDQSP
ncbi:MAG: hypothetical protein BRC29_00795 [Nanohaloarchaea archaeon SW_7_43_1]|nr:MAG: hypothetical protein BRC29_00795 [Nanohaloarchaea archaeon SW_7_43_1]